MDIISYTKAKKALDTVGDVRRAETVTLNPKRAYFAFQFDGGYIANYTTLLPAMEAVGVYVGLGAIVEQTVGAHRSSSTDSATYYSIKQLKDAYDRGHEVTNHAWRADQNMKPGSSVSATTLETWTNRSNDVWLAHGIETPIWITPNGGGVTNQTVHLDPAYLPTILERHAVAFGRTDFPHQDGTELDNLTYGLDTPLNLVGLVNCGMESYINSSGVETNDPATQLLLLKLVADYAIKYNRCVIFHHHNISNGKFPLSYVLQIKDYVTAQGGVWASNKDVLSAFSNVFDRGVYQRTQLANYQDTRHTVDENLLKSSNFPQFDVLTSTAGGYTLTENSLGRTQSSQYTLAFTGLTNGLGITMGSILDRPFDVFEYGTLTVSIGLQDAANGADLRFQLVVDAYNAAGGSGGGGTKLFTESSDVIAVTAVTNERMDFSFPVTNFFSNNTVQSMQFSFKVNSTGVSATGTMYLFNPQVNRGPSKGRFIKKVI